MYIEDLNNNYQWAYTRVVERLEELGGIEDKSKEEVRTTLNYMDIEKHLTRLVNEKEFDVVAGRIEKYVKGLINKFVKSFKGTNDFKMVGLVVGQEFQGVKDLVDIKVGSGDFSGWDEVVELVTTFREIESVSSEYIPTVDMLERAIREELVKELEKFNVKRSTIESVSTVNLYKIVAYGDLYKTEEDVKGYQKEWLDKNNFTGNPYTEDEKVLSGVASKIYRVVEGGFREASKREEQVAARFLSELLLEINNQGKNVTLRVNTLDTEGSTVIYVGDRYEVLIRKRFTLHKNTIGKTSHHTVLLTESVHKIKVGQIKEVARKIVGSI